MRPESVVWMSLAGSAIVSASVLAALAVRTWGRSVQVQHQRVYVDALIEVALIAVRERRARSANRSPSRSASR